MKANEDNFMEIEFKGNNGLTYIWEEGSDTILELESTMIYELETPDQAGVQEFLSWL